MTSSFISKMQLLICFIFLLLSNYGIALRSSIGADFMREQQFQQEPRLTFILIKRQASPWQRFEKKDVQLPSFNLDTLAGIGLGKRSSPYPVNSEIWKIES